MLKQGDWVEIVRYSQSYDHVLGYIDSDPKHGMAKFVGVRHLKRGSQYKGEMNIDVKYLVKHKAKLSKAEWLEMIDWALDDLDKETFDALMQIKEFIGG